MTHEELQEQIELYALGVLDANEKAAIDAHLLGGCARCTQALSRAAAMNAAMLATVPEAEPRAGFRSKLIARIAPQRRSRTVPLWIGIAAALAVAMVWLAAESADAQRQLAELTADRALALAETARLRSTVEFLRDPETRPATMEPGEQQQPRGTYFVNPQAGVLLIASNLQQLGPDKVFEMWVIPQTGAPRPAGTFRPDDTGTAVHLAPDPSALADAKALAITVEPAGGSAAPTTTPLLVTPVAGD